MTDEQKYFLSHATMLYDTREKENFAVLKIFAHLGLKTRRETFSTADYSFEIDGVSYKDKWLGERKGSLTELYNNIFAANKDKTATERNNLEEELSRARQSGICELILFVQGCSGVAELKRFVNKNATKHGQNAGRHIYSTLVSWGCNNRYGFKTVFAKTQEEIANEIVAHAFYFWRNEMKREYGDNFLKVLREKEKNK